MNPNLILRFVVLAIFPAAIWSTCNSTGDKYEMDVGVNMDLKLTSSAFDDNQSIPRKYTCDAENLSPSLAWSGAPEATRQFVLIVEDPDAPRGSWVHWVIYEIPGDVTALPEGLAKVPYIESVGKQGENDFGKIGYDGPCPPPGRAHRYIFKLYALDNELDLPDGASKDEIERAIQGHILSLGQLIGLYSR
jgi:Raf kinase inhibitor-like YbhB/YbcL family protein